ncbi:hypothetical protein [Usitatibacter palustris]|uniref:Lipoprotein n=1 Tax=Usitatibacter palustris TaxID=2732487 RepID=A0A6M4H7X3_9PROT|nr:hypothetical protein [Usitatibacter palustris]QJR15265.1 hypothetical protein DSM104440_02082 [Usitatibacter palustris]
MNPIPRIAFALAACFLLSSCSDPRSTRLPLDVADIPKLQPQLDKLSAEERDLVLAYLKRSKGDVLPPKFADPDAPLTARTFKEAIKLQREWNVKFAAQEERAEARRDAADAKLEPLRKTVSITVLRREIMTADEAMGREPQQGVPLNTRKTLVVTYRLQNHVADTVTRLQGSVSIRTESDPDSLMGIASCWIDRHDPIPGSQSVEVRCGGKGAVSDATQAFIDLPESSLIVRWEPKLIELSSGKTLRAE